MSLRGALQDELAHAGGVRLALHGLHHGTDHRTRGLHRAHATAWVIADMPFGSYAESPGIDGSIYFTSDSPVEAGDFVRVRITGAMDGELTGERTEE